VIVRAVIAVRGGEGAKTRCVPHLDAQARGELVRAMLLDMVAALGGGAGGRVDEIEVVTPTPELAQAAREAGARVHLETQAHGLNAAFEAARARLRETAPGAVMVALPGDLPLLDAAELAPALAALTPKRVGLAPASADGGTGAVILHAGAPFAFHFGSDSFHRHWTGAVQAGLEPFRLEAPGLGLDIDRPEDLAALEARGGGERTARLLARLLRRTEALP
jgi:2-phospho-L-lactate guanylyltransferase